ncbi:hypothetical protein AB4238_02820 [Shewanella sp. 10N.286.45.A1]|uniref:hypothetical protein n=1 Tax=Shewanella sp. 10N.286.45.A1 TaxID=3229694 RepID=UPI003553ABC1
MNELINKVKYLVSQNEIELQVNDDLQGFFSLPVFIKCYEYTDGSISETDRLIYERILKKIDVVKHLYVYYSNDLSIKSTEILLSERSTNRLALNLLHLTILKSDLKYLNSLLKMSSFKSIPLSDEITNLITDVKEWLFSKNEHN